jgi:hypothetical protein
MFCDFLIMESFFKKDKWARVCRFLFLFFFFLLFLGLIMRLLIGPY